MPCGGVVLGESRGEMSNPIRRGLGLLQSLFMESLNLHTLASSLPTSQQNAEKELANNFKGNSSTCIPSSL